jgi:hypothetical protein
MPPSFRKRLISCSKGSERVLFALFKAKVVALREKARGAVPLFVCGNSGKRGIEAEYVIA